MWACKEFDEFNQCLEWIEVTMLLPALSVEDAATLATAICILWASAWVWKILRNAA